MIGTFENGQHYRFYQELTTQILALVQRLRREWPDDLRYRGMDFSHVLESQLYFATVLDQAINRLEEGHVKTDCPPLSSDLAVLLARHWFGRAATRPFERHQNPVLRALRAVKWNLDWNFAWSAPHPQLSQAALPQCDILLYARSKRFADYLAPLKERLGSRTAYLLSAEAWDLQQEMAAK